MKVEGEGDIIVEDEGEEEEEEEEIKRSTPVQAKSLHRSPAVHQLAFEPWLVYHQPLPICIPSPGSRREHVIYYRVTHGPTSLRLLVFHLDTTKQDSVNLRIA